MDEKRLAEIERGWIGHKAVRKELQDDIRELVAEVRRLQTILDGRPAINAGLPETYIQWSQGIYETDMARCAGMYRS